MFDYFGLPGTRPRANLGLNAIPWEYITSLGCCFWRLQRSNLVFPFFHKRRANGLSILRLNCYLIDCSAPEDSYYPNFIKDVLAALRSSSFLKKKIRKEKKWDKPSQLPFQLQRKCIHCQRQRLGMPYHATTLFCLKLTRPVQPVQPATQPARRPLPTCGKCRDIAKNLKLKGDLLSPNTCYLDG